MVKVAKGVVVLVAVEGGLPLPLPGSKDPANRQKNKLKRESSGQKREQEMDWGKVDGHDNRSKHRDDLDCRATPSMLTSEGLSVRCPDDGMPRRFKRNRDSY